MYAQVNILNVQAYLVSNIIKWNKTFPHPRVMGSCQIQEGECYNLSDQEFVVYKVLR